MYVIDAIYGEEKTVRLAAADIQGLKVALDRMIKDEAKMSAMPFFLRVDKIQDVTLIGGVPA